MSRFRVVVGLLAVAVGTAWWSGSLAVALTGVVTAAPYLLLVVAVVGGVRAFVPRGVLLGPAILLAVGLVWLLLRGDLVGSWEWHTVLAGTLVIGGVAMALTEGPGATEPVSVRRCRTLAWPRKVPVVGPAPWKLSAFTALALLKIDLTKSEFPVGFPVIEIDMTVLGGRVDLVLPDDWSVALGRLHSQAMHFDGPLDLSQPVHYPAHLADMKLGGKWVLVNILGLAGSVNLTKKKVGR